jgi:NAD(P)-dependent dehydrogenase (short-subunit alcohol dehydrogenase family)
MSSDRVVLITGGGGGMGRAIAARFLESGAKVALADFDAARLDQAKAGLDPKGDNLIGIRTDITKVADCERMVKETVARFGRLDVLVAGAGVWTEGPADEATEAEWNKVIDVNLKGVFFSARYAIPHLEKTGGTIINIASDAGVTGNAGASIYCASKGGVVIMTKALAVELAPRGIRALSICPGDVETPMLSYQADTFGNGNPEGYLQALRDKYPQRHRQRFIKPEEIGELVFMAASSKLSALTGATINFDFAISAGY